MATPDPFDLNSRQEGPRIVIAPWVQDPVTKETHVHEAYHLTQEPWAEEEHIRPFKGDEKFGDVESWVAYVKRFTAKGAVPFLTWNANGLLAVLDYPTDVTIPTRCQIRAEYPFTRSLEWRAWREFANGQPVDQATAVEKLDDMAPDIVDPMPSVLRATLSSLRKSVGMISESSIRPDGTATVNFSKDTTVRAGVKAEGGATVDLPSEFRIGIPVLKGHLELVTKLDDAGKPVLNADGTEKQVLEPVRYRLEVKIRVADSKESHLVFRFSMPRADQALEAVYQDRIATAQALLGADLKLLRAADSR